VPVPAFAHTDTALQFWMTKWNDYLTDNGPVSVGLYINDFTPVPGVVDSDLTECNLSDYERQSVGIGAWTQGVVDHVQILTAPNPVTFETTDVDGQLCYGYFVYDEQNGFMLWCQLFDEPQLLKVGVPISFTPRDKLKDCPED